MLDKLCEIFGRRQEKRAGKNEEGQALVELAFVLPILLLLVFGIIEFGNIFFTHLTMNNATRDGARTGAIIATHPDVDLEEEISRGDDLEVELEYYRKLLTPLFGMILDTEEEPGYTKLTSITTMRVE